VLNFGKVELSVLECSNDGLEDCALLPETNSSGDGRPLTVHSNKLVREQGLDTEYCSKTDTASQIHACFIANAFPQHAHSMSPNEKMGRDFLEYIQLPAERLDYFLWSHKSNINQSSHPGLEISCTERD